MTFECRLFLPRTYILPFLSTYKYIIKLDVWHNPQLSYPHYNFLGSFYPFFYSAFYVHKKKKKAIYFCMQTLELMN